MDGFPEKISDYTKSDTVQLILPGQGVLGHCGTLALNAVVVVTSRPADFTHKARFEENGIFIRESFKVIIMDLTVTAELFQLIHEQAVSKISFTESNYDGNILCVPQITHILDINSHISFIHCQ